MTNEIFFFESVTRYSNERAQRIQGRFNKANAEHYKHVDWAIDISQANFSVECEIRSAPTNLIRRDAETQMITNRDLIMSSKWTESKLSTSGSFGMHPAI